MEFFLFDLAADDFYKAVRNEVGKFIITGLIWSSFSLPLSPYRKRNKRLVVCRGAVTDNKIRVLLFWGRVLFSFFRTANRRAPDFNIGRLQRYGGGARAG